MAWEAVSLIVTDMVTPCTNTEMNMPILSNLFADDSSSANSSDLITDITGGLSVNLSNETYSQDVDDDGSMSTDYQSTDLGTDLDFGSILGSMTDSFSESDGGDLLG